MENTKAPPRPVPSGTCSTERFHCPFVVHVKCRTEPGPKIALVAAGVYTSVLSVPAAATATKKGEVPDGIVVPGANTSPLEEATLIVKVLVLLVVTAPIAIRTRIPAIAVGSTNAWLLVVPSNNVAWTVLAVKSRVVVATGIGVPRIARLFKELFGADNALRLTTSTDEALRSVD